MEALELIKKTREYLGYLEDHILNIRRAWAELQDKCKDMRFVYDDFVYNSIGGEVEQHDLSKLSEFEFVQYRKSFYPAKSETEFDMSEAWEHHKLKNPHHWQHWTNKIYSDPYSWEVHCVHMIIDWMAMGYKFEDTAQTYYENNKSEIDLPDYAIKFIYEIFDRLGTSHDD